MISRWRLFRSGLRVTEPDPDDLWRYRPNAPAHGTYLCHGQNLLPGTSRGFAFGRGRSAFSMFVVYQNGRFHGYLNLCPHFSLPLNDATDQFMAGPVIQCVQHFAQFRVDDGVCTAGACVGSRLDRVPVHLDAGGNLLIG
jgi:nitrite reductase/ring-hydroxylating ferredoxin subunit